MGAKRGRVFRNNYERYMDKTKGVGSRVGVGLGMAGVGRESSGENGDNCT